VRAEEADHQFQKVPPADTETKLDKLRRIFKNGRGGSKREAAQKKAVETSLRFSSAGRPSLERLLSIAYRIYHTRK
jgi:hypothetical protein